MSVFCVVDRESNWSQCPVIAYSKYKLSHDPGNVLLFSYDGLTKRSGNLRILSDMSNCFSEDAIFLDFLSNAVRILKYQEDSLKFEIISKILIRQKWVSPVLSDLNESQNTSEDYTSPLSPFFTLEVRKRLSDLLKSGMPLYDCYSKLRETYARDFICACKKYAALYPGKSIY